VTSVGSDVSAPYELSVLNPQGVYYVVVFTDKANWTAASPYSLIARQ
jgi:NADPH-dependent 7-cyano-7-deazaguanine reductase QueF-like protein